MLFLGFHDDRDDARELARQLHAVGVDVWCSAYKRGRKPGTPWPKETVKAIYTAHGFCALLGPKGIGGALDEEISHATARRRTDKSFAIFSVALPGAVRDAAGKLDVPFELRIYEAIELVSDWRERDGDYFRELALELGQDVPDLDVEREAPWLEAVDPPSSPVTPSPTPEPEVSAVPEAPQPPAPPAISAIRAPAPPLTPSQRLELSPPLEWSASLVLSQMDHAALSTQSPTDAPRALPRPMAVAIARYWWRQRRVKLAAIVLGVATALFVVWRIASSGERINPASTTEDSGTKDSAVAAPDPRVEPIRPLLEMVSIPGGTFRMGDDASSYSAEKPAHDVTVRPFLLSRCEVTRRQFREVMDESSWPAEWRREENDDDLPANYVSWSDAVLFCNRLSEREKVRPRYEISGKSVRHDFASYGYRLPSESEWEYACRAGGTSSYGSGDGEQALADVGWYMGNADGHVHAVRQKPGNEFHLHDMHGNVWEWCEDTWHDNYDGVPLDGSAWVGEAFMNRVKRGGSFAHSAEGARSAARHRGRPSEQLGSVGFRPARSIATD